MTAGRHDIAIAGGGLSGGLIALALRRARPDLDVVLVEAGAAPGGNHRWSWVASGLDDAGAALLSAVRITCCDEGYDVAFPAHARRLTTVYRSLASTDFAATLGRELAHGAIRCNAPISALDAAGLTLASGERIAARTVIDCRGFEPGPQLCGGWQVFMGRHLRTTQPHGLTRPVIMDARPSTVPIASSMSCRWLMTSCLSKTPITPTARSWTVAPCRAGSMPIAASMAGAVCCWGMKPGYSRS